MAETTFTLWRQRLGYGIADLSCNLVWQMISLYLMFFYTDVMGLPAYYVGLMFLVTRLVDGVADVLMGLVIDNTATRWGRCRPYLLIGALPFGLLCILAFYVPDFGTTGKLIYAFITYLCLSFLYTLVNIPFCAMLPFLTNDSRERTTLSAVRILLGSLGATIVAVATLPLVSALGKGNQQHGFFYTAVVFGVIATFFLLVSFRNVKENISITQERMTLKRAWVSLRANRPWFVFAINIFLMWGAFFFQTGALVYFFHYYVGNNDLTAIVAGISTRLSCAPSQYTWSAKPGRYFCTGSSRSICPRSSRIMAAQAVTGLLMENMRKMVSRVMGRPASRSAYPAWP